MSNLTLAKDKRKPFLQMLASVGNEVAKDRDSSRGRSSRGSRGSKGSKGNRNSKGSTSKGSTSKVSRWGRRSSDRSQNQVTFRKSNQ